MMINQINVNHSLVVIAVAVISIFSFRSHFRSSTVQYHEFAPVNPFTGILQMCHFVGFEFRWD